MLFYFQTIASRRWNAQKGNQKSKLPRARRTLPFKIAPTLCIALRGSRKSPVPVQNCVLLAAPGVLNPCHVTRRMRRRGSTFKFKSPGIPWGRGKTGSRKGKASPKLILDKQTSDGKWRLRKGNLFNHSVIKLLHKAWRRSYKSVFLGTKSAFKPRALITLWKEDPGAY